MLFSLFGVPCFNINCNFFVDVLIGIPVSIATVAMISSSSPAWLMGSKNVLVMAVI